MKKKFDYQSMIWLGDATLVDGEAGMLECRLDFQLTADCRLDLYVVADQYYILYHNGKLLARKNEYGSLRQYPVDHLEVDFSAGIHTFSLLVWGAGKYHAVSVESAGIGFACGAAQEEYQSLFAPECWQMRRVEGVSFAPHFIIPNGWTGVAAPATIDLHAFNHTPVNAWRRVDRLTLAPRHLSCNLIRQRSYPEMVLPAAAVYAEWFDDYNAPIISGKNKTEMVSTVNALLRRNANWQLAPKERCRILLHLHDYYCGYCKLTFSGGGGAKVSVRFAEALFSQVEGMEKGRRDEYWGKYFRGICDLFILPGGTDEIVLPQLFWRSGNFIELVIDNSGDEVLTCLGMEFEESGYPWTWVALPHTGIDEFDQLSKCAGHTLKMSIHDNFYDCPYYEQLPYTGDGRIELLTFYTLSTDTALPEKMMNVFTATATVNGLCGCRTPSAMIPSYIPSFSLWYIGMVHDYAYWKNQPETVLAALPAIHSTLAYFLDLTEEEGVYCLTDEYWNFLDWVPSWGETDGWWGIPPRAGGVNCTLNWLLVYALKLAAELEENFGDRRMAIFYREKASAIARRLEEFFDPEKSLYYDDRTRSSFCEHAQLLALLAGELSEERCLRIFEAMIANPEVAVGSVFFSHYYFVICAKFGRPDLMKKRMQPYFNCLKQGFRTLPETFVDSRSDCHGWGALVLYHLAAGFGGIMPADYGFRNVYIRPQLGDLDKLEVTVPHPAGGVIHCDYRKGADGKLTARIDLPAGVKGIFEYQNHKIEISSNDKEVCL